MAGGVYHELTFLKDPLRVLGGSENGGEVAAEVLPYMQRLNVESASIVQRR